MPLDYGGLVQAAATLGGKNYGAVAAAAAALAVGVAAFCWYLETHGHDQGEGPGARRNKPRPRNVSCAGCGSANCASCTTHAAVLDAAAIWRGSEPLERRLEGILQLAEEEKVKGDALCRRRLLDEALQAYAMAHTVLGFPSHHEILPASLERWRAISSALPASQAAVYVQLGQLQAADNEFGESLLVEESAEVHMCRGKAREALGKLGMALQDYTSAARLAGGAAGEAPARLAAVAARLGRDGRGAVRYQWQRDWAAAEAPAEMQEGMKVLLKRPPSGRRGAAVRWGELNARPGPRSDLCWDALSSRSAKARFEATNNFQRAGMMLSAGWAAAWSTGRGGGDVAKGHEMWQHAADGKHDHAFCGYYISALPGRHAGLRCVLQMPDIRSTRGGAITALVRHHETARGSAVLEAMPVARLKALYQLGANKLRDNRVQLLYARSYDLGHVWAKDVGKHLKWLETAAANPHPTRKGMAAPMRKLATALATGLEGEIEPDLDRAEKLVEESLRLDSREEAKQECNFIRSTVAGMRLDPMWKVVFSSVGMPPSGNSKSHCQKCGKPAASGTGQDEDGGGGGGFKKCQRCLRVVYCSRACQRADWSEHKKVCKD
eukprot:jgi/Tetstr1/461965/TSEL_007038.t1